MSFPASNNGPGGRSIASQDVCNTPRVEPAMSVAPPAATEATEEVPVSYTSTAVFAMATLPTLAHKVFIVGKHAVTTNTEIWMSTGNEEGTGGGVVSGSVAGPCRVRAGSRKVFIEGHGAAYLGVLVGHNNTANSNMPTGQQEHASQGKVFVGP